ncbi:solute carrier family 2, facilitated glucose transporter member 8-like isoform X2 [Photinus pyralis]|uniref:Major facilitator superfamily (MFS) profile domain-containing protein n=1 Tax=Photinus pyralis TaxID=7054 RepID=A0A1Y1LDZ3_PHOPY|nr:solute carrier family 2, facilitated glucose transporter member 8-like isoform X2 [Photinus pyralis]
MLLYTTGVTMKPKMMLTGRPLQYFGASFALLNMFGSGFHLAWSSPFLPLLERDPSTRITKDEGSWIATIYLIAGPFGAILASVVVNRIGRKMSLLLSALPYLTSWAIIAITQRIGFILSARFIGGMAEGVIYTVLPVYIGELADPQIRGFLISLMGILSMVAALVVNVLGYYLNITHSSIICAIPHILFLFSFPFLPETPNHYIVRGELDKARDTLGQVRGRAVDDEEIKELNCE